MDRHLSPRIAYWCSSFDTDMEALAGEVATLRRAFPGSVSWGIAARDWLRLSPSSGFGCHPKLHWLFRAATGVLQRCFDVQHLFGSLGDWFHLRAVAKRPVVLTVAVQTGVCEKRLLDKVDRFVVEWPHGPEKLAELGIDSRRVETILPPVDLLRFRPTPPPDGPFTVLFASSPDQESWLHARGVPLLLEAAARCPHYRFLLVWRPWGNSLPRLQAWIAERRLANVEVMVGRFRDMAAHYARSHVGVAPFIDMERCKPMPNSLVESLACGRPVVVTPHVELAPLVTSYGAGMVSQSTAESLVESLHGVEASWQNYSAAARRLAESEFSHERFIESYRRLYSELT